MARNKTSKFGAAEGLFSTQEQEVLDVQNVHEVQEVQEEKTIKETIKRSMFKILEQRYNKYKMFMKKCLLLKGKREQKPKGLTWLILMQIMSISVENQREEALQ